LAVGTGGVAHFSEELAKVEGLTNSILQLSSGVSTRRIEKTISSL